MAQQQPNPQMFAGIDFSQYPTWQKIVTPRGTVLYVVPGTGWVYDPFLSAAKGRPVLSPNPQPEIDDRQRNIDNQNANTRAQSPEGQILPVVGQIGGTAAGVYIWNNPPFGSDPKPVTTGNQPVQNPNPSGQSPTPTTPTTGQPTTPAQGFQQGAQTGSPVVTSGNTVPPGGTIPEGYTAVGSAADGGTIIAPTDQVGNIPPEALNDPGFLSSVDWAQVAQGATTVAQAYAAYRSYQSGDNVGAGIYGAAAVGNAAAMGGSQLAAQAVPYLNVAAGAYGGYQTQQYQADAPAGRQRDVNSTAGGAMSGASIGSYWGYIGAGIGAAIGAVVGFTGSKFGSSKGKAQFTRDGIRKVLQDNKILDENWQGTLADGSAYDFGKDGSTLKWSEIDKVANENKAAWDGSIPLADAIAVGYGFVGQNASNISAWYNKAAVSNANNDPEVSKANIRHFARQQGITYEMIKQKLDEAKAEGRIDEAQYNYYLGGAQQLAQGQPPAPAAPPPGTPPQAPPQTPPPSTRGPKGAAPIGPPPGTQGPAAAPAPAPAPTLPPRSRTLSPGINLQGQRINYADMGRQLAERYNRRRR